MDNKTIYNLVVQYQLGNYEVIDLNELSDSMNLQRTYDLNTSLASIDSFTSKYTAKELTDFIVQANMTTKNFNQDQLRIISNHKHNHSVMTKEVLDNVKEFRASEEAIDVITSDGLRTKDVLRGKFNNIIDKKFDKIIETEYINKLNAAIGDSVKDILKYAVDKQKVIKDLFNRFLKVDSRYGICIMIKCLPYEMARTLYFVMNHDIIMRKKDSFDNTRNLKKVNDIA